MKALGERPELANRAPPCSPEPAEIERYLAEDLGAGDLTAAAVPAERMASAALLTREAMVLCGRSWFEGVFALLDPTVSIDWEVEDGRAVPADTVLCRMRGRARALLSGERTALNLLQVLSGTATRAAEYARAVAGTGVRVLDTRKTIPGLREAQKYAVRCGGCYNHRLGLYDAILIKENHIAAAGSIANAVAAAQSLRSGAPIEVEVENIPELETALSLDVERVLLDNFDLPRLRQAVAVNAGRAKLEASGNVTLANIRDIAGTGVDFISVGDLTKNVRAIDLSLRIGFDS